MIDFSKFRHISKRPGEIDPLKLFDSLAKSDNINDLYNGQASVLSEWHRRRDESDVIIKMPTGAGKTMVGLLIAQSYMNETGGPAVYLVENKQLVGQVLEQAKRIGIRAFAYEGRTSIGASFLNGESLLVGSYQVIFNGKSIFDSGNLGAIVPLRCIVVDDAHAALSTVRNAFSVTVRKEKLPGLFDRLVKGLGSVFDEIDQGATYRDLIGASSALCADSKVLEVPYWAYRNIVGSIERDITAEIRDSAGDMLDDSLAFSWPLIKDGLRYCRMLIGQGRVTIAPYVPDLSRIPAFRDAAHRVYMSATFADESAIVRVFDVGEEAISHPVAPRMLAGVGMKLILSVSDGTADLAGFAKQCSAEGYGSVVLCPSRVAARRWEEFEILAVEGDAVAKAVDALNHGKEHGPFVFANRYNGIDLPNEACRLLIVDGLPEGGMDDIDRLEQKYLSSSAYYARIVAQRVEQGIGRAARGSSDYCAVALHGSRLVEWVKSRSNKNYFSRETRALLTVGEVISAEVRDMADITSALKQVVDGDREFMEYCASEVAELVDKDEVASRSDSDIETARAIRVAIRLWSEGHGAKGVAKLEACARHLDGDAQLAGYLLLLAARIAYQTGDVKHAQNLHHRARELNRAIFPFKVDVSSAANDDWQVEAILARCQNGLEEFNWKTCALEDDRAKPSKYEEALKDLGYYLGFESERCDKNGDGPDVFWRTGDGKGFVIEVKNGKKANSEFDKQEQGQLQVAVLWCQKNHPELDPIPISVHPTAFAHTQAYAEGTLVLTTQQVKNLCSYVRKLVESSKGAIPLECSSLLDEFNLRPAELIENYMQNFKLAEKSSGNPEFKKRAN